jgi:2-octaprenylphenol hydroxylase
LIIVGAGLVGASLALTLAKHTDFSIALVEAGSSSILSDVPPPGSPQRGLRVSALGKTARAMLEDVGVWQALTIKSAYQKMRVWDHVSDAELGFDCNDYQLSELGHIVDNFECLAQLHQRLMTHEQITCYFNARPISLVETESGVSAVYQSLEGLEGHEGQEFEFNSRLLIACDGRGSWIRQQIGIATKSYDYQQKGVVALVKGNPQDGDTAWQNFLATGPIALLPYDQDLFSIVWSADNELANSLVSMPVSEFNQRLNNVLAPRLANLELVSERLSFPLSSQLARRFCKGRVALVGDSAHAIHPLAGQGANLGFADATLLSKMLVDLDDLSSPSVNKRLRDYSKQRKLDADITDKMMTSLYLSTRQIPSWMEPIRGGVIDFLNHNSMIKKRFVLTALGIN